MFYFGCEDGPGHYLFVPSRYGSTQEPLAAYDALTEAGIYSRIDGGFCPGVDWDPEKPRKFPKEQVEGHAKLTHFNGWTILSFWDRSVDQRRGSNSNFIAHGCYTFEKMLAMAKAAYSWVWQRIEFEVVEVES